MHNLKELRQLTKNKVPIQLKLYTASRKNNFSKEGSTIETDNKGATTGIITDGQIRRVSQKHGN